MRKYILATVLLAIFVCWLGPAGTLLSKFLRLEQPTYHEIQNGDWLSKIAQQYYGDPSYWHELELVNRAPNGDRIYPGEQIIIPSFEVVDQIRRAKKLSVVNELVREQQAKIKEVAMSEPRQPREEETSVPAPAISQRERPAEVAEPSESPAGTRESAREDEELPQVAVKDAPILEPGVDNEMGQEEASGLGIWIIVGIVVLFVALAVIYKVVSSRDKEEDDLDTTDEERESHFEEPETTDEEHEFPHRNYYHLEEEESEEIDSEREKKKDKELESA